MQIRF